MILLLVGLLKSFLKIELIFKNVPLPLLRLLRHIFF